jgi:4-hydroxybenzoate polyprenyltransferase
MSLIKDLIKSKKLLQFFNHNLALFGFFHVFISYLLGIDGLLFLKNALFLFSSFFLLGCFVYILNDFFDENQDAISDKYNITASWRKELKIFSLIFFSFFGIFVLGIYVNDCIPFLVLQVVLLLLYSAPQIRLKERGFIGVLFDALYAYVNPAFILLVFLDNFSKVSLFIYIILPLMYFFIGLKNIFQHQLDDLINDLKSGVKTFAHSHAIFSKKAVTLSIGLSLFSWFLFMIFVLKSFFTLTNILIALIPFLMAVIRFLMAIIKNNPNKLSGIPEFHVLFFGFFILWIHFIINKELYYLVSSGFLLLPVMYKPLIPLYYHFKYVAGVLLGHIKHYLFKLVKFFKLQ